MSDKGRRMQKIDRELREIVATFVSQDMRGLIPGLATVTRVLCTQDLRQAKVYVSILGSREEQEAALEILDGAAVEIQARINKLVRMKFVPKLEFYLDDTTEEVFRIQAALKNLNRSEGSGSAS